jgi:hypothetical protein
MRGGYFAMSKAYVETMPIVETQNTDLELISKQIQSIKKQEPKTETTNLESQIDQLVCQLYGLTDEEIEITENSVR